MEYLDLSGTWRCEIPGLCTEMQLPGTLDENGIGFPDDPSHQWMMENVRRIGYWQPGDPIVTRLTRKHTFEGMARISRTLDWEVPGDARIFVDVERARQLHLQVNGRDAAFCRPASLSTPYCFEVTGLVTGHDEFTFLSDNSYPGWPRDAIVYASAASDETQTNWNGLLGFIRLRTEQPVFFSDLRVYPRDQELQIAVSLDASRPWSGTLHFAGDVLAEEASFPVEILPGKQEFSFRLKQKKTALLWDLEDGILHRLTVSAAGLDPRTVQFGIRDFSVRDGHFCLNGRRIFLRSEANCAVFPETGYCPMGVCEWKDILKKYRAYGVNCLRFHSHCPPEAAFTAADEMGMLMQPELSHWDPNHAFASAESQAYYTTELLEILRQLANHPSFVLLTMGNELHADPAGHAFMDELLRTARKLDPTRLYANGSNVHYGEAGTDPGSDFYTAMRFRDMDMRATCDGMTGWLNREPPNSCRDYSRTMEAIRRETCQPVFSFEVGQYEVLPDPGEPAAYRGITCPQNLLHLQAKVREKGLQEDWKRMMEATGESSLLCYRAEVEAALRTEGYSGISLLGLQDFPGQGTALVGMMNAHLEPKPGAFARPERFSAFFRDVLPLVLLEKFTFTAGETLAARVRIANYGKADLSGSLSWELQGQGWCRQGKLQETTAKAGGLSDCGTLQAVLSGIPDAVSLTLTVSFCGFRNTYPLWVYPEVQPVCPEPVYECRVLDSRAEQVLQRGGTVYLAPDSTEEALPHSLNAQFSPDFWSVCTFPQQEGGMGLLIDDRHPLFAHFPTRAWATWQWWPMAGQRAMILPERIRCIITEMDSYAFLRPMAMLFECRCGNGRLLVSSLGLHQLQQYPEARALQHAIYQYLSSEHFQPEQTLSLSWLHSLFQPS